MQPVLNKKTNQVFCTECGKEIHTVDQFMKRQMDSLGQLQKTEKRRLAWSTKCNDCGKEGPPILDKDGKILLCSYCNKPMTGLNKPFEAMVKEHLRGQRKMNP